MNYKDIWVVAETQNGFLLPQTLELMNKGKELACSIAQNLCVVLIGEENKENEELLRKYDADTIISIEHREYKHYETKNYTNILAVLIEKYKPLVVMISASNNGRTLGARLSARKNLGLIAGCCDMAFKEDKKTLVCLVPISDGNRISNIVCKTLPQLVTVENGIFMRIRPTEKKSDHIIRENIAPSEEIKATLHKVIGEVTNSKKNLETAEIVVGIGMGIQNKQNLPLIEEFAKEIGAAVGVSKPLVDEGWVSETFQVGINGKKVAPDIYFAIGISGSLNHIIGMEKSKLIIAINDRATAPIFQYADYGIVGDLFEIIPMLQQEFKKIKK